MRTLSVKVDSIKLEVVVLSSNKAAVYKASHLREARTVLYQLKDITVLNSFVDPLTGDGVPLEHRIEKRTHPGDCN